MDEAEYNRLRDVQSTYRRNLMTAADSNFTLGQFKFAKRQYLALLEPELELTGSDAAFVHCRLTLPDLALAGLAHRGMRGDGNSEWLFDESFSESLEDDEEPPIQGVQTDERSVCPLVCSHAELIDEALALADVKSTDIIADLGCGDGRLLLKAGRLGCRAVGFDVNPFCIRRSRAAAAAAGLSHLVEVANRDLFALAEHPRFLEASVVYVYLVPKVVARLEPLLRAAVDSGKRVLIFCTTGGSATPGNVIGSLIPARISCRGRLRMYCLQEPGT